MPDEFWVDIDEIPGNYRSHHLRFFFSDFVEGDKFSLCHYTHRKSPHLNGFHSVSASFPSENLRSEFISRYEGSHWTLNQGEEVLPFKCSIRSIEANEAMENKPPGQLMPKGNIGTSTAFFKPLISSCQLPPKIIAKLRLQFRCKKGKYGYVSPFHGPPSLERISSKLDDVVEEWDRHEALHDDVSARRVLSGDPDNVSGTKERTFEDEVEVTWDKGSSGLVFHTDASFWKEVDAEKGEADDWDVDMAKYEGGRGDKDSADYCSMRNFYKRSMGQTAESVFSSSTRRKKGARIGAFESHTRGFGGKLMRRQGWNEGDGLGSVHNKGISVPINSRGQNHRGGLGFNIKPQPLPFMTSAKRRKEQNCIISTVFDDPKETDPLEKVFERNPDNYLKHRD